MLRALPQLLVVVVAVLAFSACGGDPRADYQRDLAAAGQVVADALDALPDDEASSIDPPEVRALAKHLRDAADQVEELDPQPGVSDAQDRLERGLRGVATSFDELADQLDDAETEAEKAERFVAFATDSKVDSAFEDLVRAQEAFADKGFRVFPKGGALTTPRAAAASAGGAAK